MNKNLQPVNWNTLYKLGGISALLMVVIVVIQGTVSVIAPQPLDGSALDWFLFFQKNTLIGLLDFELLMAIYVVLSLPIVLSLYTLLRQVSPTWTTLYAVLSGLGVVFFVASSVFDFGLYIPTIGIYISMFSVLFLLIWNILIARRLFQLGKATPKESTSEFRALSISTKQAG
jgi:hypothetical protein